MFGYWVFRQRDPNDIHLVNQEKEEHMEDYVQEASRVDDVLGELSLKRSCESLKDNFQDRDVHRSYRERKEEGTDFF